MFAVKVPRGRRPPAPATAVPAAGPCDSLRGALVLVVDDDALVREAMHSLLAQWGCEVAVAADGEAAVGALRRLGLLPDALLCDYRLPGAETGIQVIRRLHAAAGTSIPAALVSGDSAPESLREAKASGYPLLPKPVAPAKLRALIDTWSPHRGPGAIRPPSRPRSARGQIAPPREDESQRIDHDRVGRRLRNEPQGTACEDRPDGGRIVQGRQRHQRQRRIVAA